MFQRIFDEGLAQASFLIGCDRTGDAVVIDPRRDAAIYLEAARQLGARLVAAIETHVHADFLSGARELAPHGIRVITGPGSHVHYPHDEVRDNERLTLGDVTLTFLHTPGHTLEHIAIQADFPDGVRRLFTGDLLFVGGVGRPDLAGDDLTRRLAGDLFDSLQRVMRLDEDIEIHPGHGAGSLCGAGIGKDPFSTVGLERRQNPMLQHRERGAFVTAVLADIPGTPPYFARMKKLNEQGPPLLESTWHPRGLPAIQPSAAAALAADGGVIIDLRDTTIFANGHPYGAINIAFGSKVGFWAGWVLPPDVPLMLLADDPAQAQEAGLQLLRVGLDNAIGAIAGGFSAWTRAGLPSATLGSMSAADLRDALHRAEPVQIVDVRTSREFEDGHIAGAINIPAGEIPQRIGEVRRDVGVATICESGFRAMLAASLLAHEGIAPLASVADGMAAYRALSEVTT